MRTRFTMDMNEDLAAKLERVRVAIGAANKADVIREALVILLTLVEAVEEGQSIFVGVSSERPQRVLIPSLETARRRVPAPTRAGASSSPDLAEGATR